MRQTAEDKAMVPELRFSGFESSWDENRLEAIADVERGKFTPRPRNDPKYYNGDMPFAQTGDIARSNFYLKEFSQSLNDLGVSVSRVFPKNTILMSIAANIGDVAILEFEVACPDSLVGIVAKEEHSHIWLYYELSKRKNELLSYATTNAQANINLEVLRPLKVKTPEPEEQKKIASFLTAVDEKLNQLRRKRDCLQTYKRGVMQKIFSQDIRFTQDDGTAFADWEEKELSEVLEPIIREVDKPKENYLAIGVRSHMKGTFQRPDSEPAKIAMDKLFVVKGGDLVVNITFAWEGAIAIVKPEDDGGLVSHRFPTYLFKEGLLRDYFRHVITQKRFKFTLDLISPGGAGRNRVLSKKDFLKIRWSFPSVDEQRKISDFLASLDAKILEMDRKVSEMEAFKKGLQQKMFV